MQRISYCSFSTSSCFLPHEYKKVIVLLLIAGATSSGILLPARSYATSPQIHTSIPAQKVTKSVPTIAHLKHVSSPPQVTQLAIGQQKIPPPSTPTPTPVDISHPYKATQIDEHTWTMSIPTATAMTSAQEVLVALNNYRQKQGKQGLVWDETLASYAQSRVATYVTLGNTDKHAAFMDFIQNQDGFKKLGFTALGENASYGYVLAGEQLIETVYAGDKPHDDNQLNSSWSHVGIGVKDSATDIVFGGNKQ